MLAAKRFIEFSAGASSQCSTADCSDGNSWVIRLKKAEYNAKRLFNAYFVGMLANDFGLAHPEVRRVTVDAAMRLSDSAVVDVIPARLLRKIPETKNARPRQFFGK